jgi:TnpA family transposase
MLPLQISLNMLEDENKRRSTLSQLNRGEGRHSLARAIFHGKRGELRQRYREGQEDPTNFPSGGRCHD